MMHVHNKLFCASLLLLGPWWLSLSLLFWWKLSKEVIFLLKMPVIVGVFSLWNT